MSFSGSGGPPPKQAREQGLSGGQKPFGYRFYEKLANGKNKTIQFIGLDRDKTTLVGEKDVKILILDEATPGGDEWQPSVYIHERFRFNGRFDNYAICRCKAGGCQLDVALQEPHSHAPWCTKPADEKNPQEGECDRLGKPQDRRGAWRWAATAIKLKPYTVKSGPNEGKVIPYTRGLLLAGEDQYKTLLTYRKAWGGLRGRIFNVSRGDGQFSPRIGGQWDPFGEPLTDEEMMEKFADSAADYGLAIEDYVRPMDYGTILALPTAEQIADIAKWVAGERGINLDGGKVEESPVTSAVGSDAEPVSDATDLPF
jgi:hypothetical protein